MLFILKKSNRSRPTIIETDACKNVPELSCAIGLGNQEPVYIFQITPDGLYALCRVRNLSDKNWGTVELHCALEVCTQESPYSVKIAVSDIAFFRLQPGCAVTNLVPSEEHRYGHTANVTYYAKYFALASITVEDILTVGNLMSPEHQDRLLQTAIDYLESRLNNLREQERIARNREGV